MRLLADSCVGSNTVAALRSAGHDVDHAAEWSDDPGDDAILLQAVLEKRVVVTRDKDFGQLVFRDHQQHLGLLRLQEVSLREPAVAVEVIAMHAQDLLDGAIVTASHSAVRVRYFRPPSADRLT